MVAPLTEARGCASSGEGPGADGDAVDVIAVPAAPRAVRAATHGVVPIADAASPDTRRGLVQRDASRGRGLSLVRCPSRCGGSNPYYLTHLLYHITGCTRHFRVSPSYVRSDRRREGQNAYTFALPLRNYASLPSRYLYALWLYGCSAQAFARHALIKRATARRLPGRALRTVLVTIHQVFQVNCGLYPGGKGMDTPFSGVMEARSEKLVALVVQWEARSGMPSEESV